MLFFSTALFLLFRFVGSCSLRVFGGYVNCGQNEEGLGVANGLAENRRGMDEAVIEVACFLRSSLHT